jgi:hypothetical protein
MRGRRGVAGGDGDGDGEGAEESSPDELAHFTDERRGLLTNADSDTICGHGRVVCRQGEYRCRGVCGRGPTCSSKHGFGRHSLSPRSSCSAPAQGPASCFRSTTCAVGQLPPRRVAEAAAASWPSHVVVRREAATKLVPVPVPLHEPLAGLPRHSDGGLLEPRPRDPSAPLVPSMPDGNNATPQAAATALHNRSLVPGEAAQASSYLIAGRLHVVVSSRHGRVPSRHDRTWDQRHACLHGLVGAALLPE